MSDNYLAYLSGWAPEPFYRPVYQIQRPGWPQTVAFPQVSSIFCHWPFLYLALFELDDGFEIVHYFLFSSLLLLAWNGSRDRHSGQWSPGWSIFTDRFMTRESEIDDWHVTCWLTLEVGWSKSWWVDISCIIGHQHSTSKNGSPKWVGTTDPFSNIQM